MILPQNSKELLHCLLASVVANKKSVGLHCCRVICAVYEYVYYFAPALSLPLKILVFTLQL